MLTPTGVTTEEYMEALAKEEVTHARVTFVVDNVVFQDEELEQDGISLSTYMNPDENMKFGIAYSTEAVIHILKSDKADEVNFSHEFVLEFGVEINGDIEWVTVGRFVGKRSVEEIGSKTIELIAYDRMVRFDRDINDVLGRITFPCTVQHIYDTLCELSVLDNVPGDEIPSVMNRQIANADNFNFHTCRELLASIAEANGCYARITNEGQVQLVWFADHTADQNLLLDNCFGGKILKLEKSYSKKWGTIETLKWKDVETIKYAEYDNNSNPFEYSYIRGMWMMETTKDIVQPPFNPYYNYRLWATAENYQWESLETMKWKELEEKNDVIGGIYTITNNPFLLFDTDLEIRTNLQYILDKLFTFHLYYVASVDMVGNWLYEVGDKVMLEISKDYFVEYPIFNRVLTWNGSCSCYYETTGTLTGLEN